MSDPFSFAQILVNNAGISAHGESLNLSLNDVKNMIQVNAFSVAELTHFFGRDMKERRRGRILFVSSICGSVSGIASVAIYSATKAFENSFGVSIGKELEPYGVGVTCLIPGAVRGTEFRSNSQSQDALCWKIPFYAKTTSSVAASGIRAMLRGNTEVMPGVLNRIFLKVCKPVLPQRLHNLVAEVMWNPVELPFKKKSTVENKAFEELPTISNVSSVIPTKRLSATRPQSFSVNLCPRTLFILEKVEPNVEAVAANVSFGELDSVDAICANEESPEKESEMKSLPDEGLMSAASETQSSPSCPGNATMEHENQVTPSTPDPTVEHKKRIAPSTNAPTAKQPSKTDSKSRTEIDLLLEQYKRNRIFSVEPFNERNYFDDPLDFRLCPSIQEMNGSS